MNWYVHLLIAQLAQPSHSAEYLCDYDSAINVEKTQMVEANKLNFSDRQQENFCILHPRSRPENFEFF